MDSEAQRVNERLGRLLEEVGLPPNSSEMFDRETLEKMLCEADRPDFAAIRAALDGAYGARP